MNIKNKKIIGSIYIFSFLKRVLICFLCIILCFNVVCKPKKTYAATLGVAVTWGLVEYLGALVASAGIALTVDAFCRGLGLYGGEEEVTEEEALQWCKNNITIDGDNNVVFTDDAKAFINDYLLGTYKDSVTMTYRYPVQVQSISADTFPNKNIYQFLLDLCLAYPDCYVFTPNAENMKMNYTGQPFQLLDGSYTEGWNTSLFQNLCMFCVIPKPFAGTTQYADLYSASTLFYNDNWEVSFSPKCFWVAPDGRCFYKTSGTYNNAVVLAKQFEPGEFPNLDDVSDHNYWSWYGTSYAMYLDSKHGASWSARTVYSASPDALNVYKSEADMKKDIGSQVIGNYIPDYYTGTPNYNITTSEVNNIVNNYYPSDPDDDSGGGSGSGSDDSGGSSSGGSGIIDGLGKLFGSIGNIIDKLFGFVLGLLSKVVDFFGSILEMFTETLTKLIDIIPSGFNEFLAAMFPYIPEEWITIAEFILLVSAIGCVVALFKR